MIISKTPLRMSFVGGGSDIASFYRQHGGAVLSTAIDKFVYVTINPKFDNGIRVSYAKTEEVQNLDEIQHPLIKAACRLVGVEGGFEITSVADIPSKGTGLGSSSTFTVGLLHALYSFKGVYASAEQLAEEACRIEIDICGEPIGKQDQYAASFGGLNFIEFYPDDTVSVDPIICRPETISALQKNLLIFFTGRTRSASTILARQTAESGLQGKTQEALRAMVGLARDMKVELQRDNLASFGEILHENWNLKKSLVSGISDPELDSWYETGRREGASGGKLLGAGQGGFLLFYAPPERHAAIVQALSFLRPVDLKFERSGSRIIFYH